MQTIEQFRLGLRIAEERMPWQYRGCDPSGLVARDNWNTWVNASGHNIGFINEIIANPNKELRIKPKEFPKLPAGIKWYNPFNLTPDDLDEGFRLLTENEVATRTEWTDVKFKPRSKKTWAMIENYTFKHTHTNGLTYAVPLSVDLILIYKFTE